MRQLYKVQVGRFKDIKDAEKQCVAVRKMGCDCIVREVDDLYTCQIAVYHSYDDAKNRLHKLFCSGLTNALIVTNTKEE